MRVSKAQVQLNRAHIVETASRLFRERGYDGVGVADLMAAAGFTHGGFYKHFGSKADLMAEAAACGFSQSLTNNAGMGARAFFDLYVSRDHRDSRDAGCTMSALCGDAARQSTEVKTTFAEGIENILDALGREGVQQSEVDQQAIRAKMLDTLAHAVGAVMLSRACPDDSPLADEILEVCRREILQSLASQTS
ncbi:TetR family transcriptional regulator [Pseudomonas brassicacearum]|uniref:TetR/AcrR family transcriptional regulator n=1 Tax=Pseudomonas brassicacearum TaxID=930166 RepID=UPI000F47F90A|nr:TetR/AcrR family transcriptional regulator [Pseudomonas brassicacearum]ROM67504.1 TetR family transcriptional regulator [Pseudomonas brassicacearum]